VARTSVLLVGMATAALMQRLFVQIGINEWNATLATLSLTLSHLFLPLTFSFMTDVPGFFVILVCLYGCVRAIKATSDRATIQWLIFTAFFNVIGGTVRQIAWLGVLMLVPSTAWVVRRRQGALVAGVTSSVVAAGFIAGGIFWFKNQPYSVSEPMFVHIHYASHKYPAILLFLLPILIAFVARYPIRERWARTQAGLITVAIVVVGGICLAMWPREFHIISQFLLAPFSNGEMTTKGLEIGGLPGYRPDVLSRPVQITLSILTFTAFLAFLVSIVNVFRGRRPGNLGAGEQISNKTILTILVPFTAAYLALMVTRAAIFERYFLPLLFVFLVFLLRFYQGHVAPRLPLLTAIFIMLFGAYGVVTFHDLLAADRAGLEAADELRAAGVSRSSIRAGFEYDGWTQIELTGHLAPKKRWPSLPRCVHWWDSDTPDIHAHYQLSYDSACFSESEFPPVRYTTWLPPHRQMIHILKRDK
jgi:hypothetical protein